MKLFMFLMLLFISSSHPMSQILIFMLMCFLNSLTISLSFKNNWYPMIFIIMILGGMLILFMYMASLASNEPFKIMKIIYSFPIVFYPIFSFLPFENFKDSNMNMIFTSMTNLNSIMCMILLFLNLLIILEIISSMKSTLRSLY